jgi:hypothetical protein
MARLARRQYGVTSLPKRRNTATPTLERYTGGEVAESLCRSLSEALGRGEDINLASPSIRAYGTAQRLYKALGEGIERGSLASLLRDYIETHRSPTEDPWTDGTELLLYVRVTKDGKTLEGYTANAYQALIIGEYWMRKEPLCELSAVSL